MNIRPETLHCQVAAIIVLAWIVWAETIGPVSTKSEWSLHKAVETLSDCNTEALSAARLTGQTMATLGSKVKVLETTVVVSQEEVGGKTSAFFIMYKCFPESIDPRR